MSEGSAVSKFREKFKSGKILEIVIVLILAAVVIAVVYSMLAGGGGEETASAAEESYAEQVERELSSVLSQIDGVGSVEVFVTAASEGETVIAMETTVDEDGNTTTSPVLVDGDVVVLKELLPEITGVLIVAEGAESVLVRIRLIDAAATALHIDQSLIKVYTKAGS